MNILHVTAQKPSATGSGVYLTQLVRAIQSSLPPADGGTSRPITGGSGLRQGILAGMYAQDVTEARITFGGSVRLYPVLFESEVLPFPIFGMSDVMPYPSARYRDMTRKQQTAYEEAFLDAAGQAVQDLRPDIIICHHLYLLTALIRRSFPDIPVYGICHNTDLIQYGAHPLAQDLISEQIPRLDGIFALHEEQRSRILKTFDVDVGRVHAVGAGYDPSIFYPPGSSDALRDDTKGSDGKAIRLVFAGKLSEAKGVPSLLRSMVFLHDLAQDAPADCKGSRLTAPPTFELTLAGSSGNADEQAQIEALASASPIPVHLAGPLPQNELADLYRRSDIFLLPSRSEGLPLSAIEALACGLKAIMTDLPGVHNWFDRRLPDAPIRYVPLPGGCVEGEVCPDFEQSLARSIMDVALASGDRADADRSSPLSRPDMSDLTWQALAGRILSVGSSEAPV